jgi:hypothetical protein
MINSLRPPQGKPRQLRGAQGAEYSLEDAVVEVGEGGANQRRAMARPDLPWLALTEHRLDKWQIGR